MITKDKFLEIVRCGETLTVEFIGEAEKRVYDDELAEAVICMANAEGGYIFLGVDDSGKITGIHESRDFFLDVDSLASGLASRILPQLHIDIQPIEHDEMIVLSLRVPKAAGVVGTCDGVYKKRYVGEGNQPACRVYMPDEIAKDLAGKAQLDYTSQKVEVLDKGALDELEVERLFSMVRKSEESDHYILDMPRMMALKQLGILREHGNTLVPTVAGLLLVGESGALAKHVPVNEVVFECFEDGGEVVREHVKEPVLRMLEKVWDFFDARNDFATRRIGSYCKKIPDYDRFAFMEAVINAVVHRDYSMQGPICIQWYHDRFELSSPGGFVYGIDCCGRLGMDTKVRNHLLYSILKHLGVVHGVGDGVEYIYQGQLKYGRILPDYHMSNEAAVVLSLYKEDASFGILEFWERHLAAGRKTPVSLHYLVIETLYRNGAHLLEGLADGLRFHIDDLVPVLDELQEWRYLRKGGCGEFLLADNVLAALGGIEYEVLPGVVGAQKNTHKAEQITTREELAVAPPSGKRSRKYMLNSTRKREDEIIAILRDAPTTGRKQMAKILGDITEDGVKYHLSKMKKYGIITRVGPDKGGYWRINKTCD